MRPPMHCDYCSSTNHNNGGHIHTYFPVAESSPPAPIPRVVHSDRTLTLENFAKLVDRVTKLEPSVEDKQNDTIIELLKEIRDSLRTKGNWRP